MLELINLTNILCSLLALPCFIEYELIIGNQNKFCGVFHIFISPLIVIKGINAD